MLVPHASRITRELLYSAESACKASLHPQNLLRFSPTPTNQTLFQRNCRFCQTSNVYVAKLVAAEVLPADKVHAPTKALPELWKHECAPFSQEGRLGARHSPPATLATLSL